MIRGSRPRGRDRQLGLGLLGSGAILDAIVDGRLTGRRKYLRVAVSLGLLLCVVLIGSRVLWKDRLAGWWWETLASLTEPIVHARKGQTRMAICRRHGGRGQDRADREGRSIARRQRQENASMSGSAVVFASRLAVLDGRG